MSDDVLIVEDEPSTARVLQVALEARGYEHLEAVHVRQPKVQEHDAGFLAL
jgi:DNA-binding response OmpR family regulator